MGLADIAIGALKSRKVRSAVVATGVRIIAAPDTNELGDQQESGISAIIGKIFDVGKSLVGWLWSGIKSTFSWSATKLFGLFVNTVSFIWNFNFNATDKELYGNIESNFVALASQAGQLTGSSIGYLVGGIIPGMAVFSFNEAIGAAMLKEVGEEGKEELVGQLSALIQSSSQNLLQAALTYGFINVRKWIKNVATNPSDPLNSAFTNLFGQSSAAKIKDWGKEGGEPWSFAQSFENLIESIDNKYLRAFVESAFEGAVESFVEAGYVVCGAWDAVKNQQRRVATQVLGNERSVQIIPDREANTEPIILTGRENLIRPLITTTMMNHQLLGNRDVGAIYGLPSSEAARRVPSNLSLTIHYSSRPPGRTVSASAPRKTHTVDVYHLKRSKLDWTNIKNAIGKNGYMFGRWSGIARLETKDKVVVYANSAQLAEERVKDICTLCDGDIVGLTINQELSEGVRTPGKPLYKEDVMIYPVYITVTNSQRTLANEKAQGTLTGNYLRKSEKLEVWMDDEPTYWSDLITELFKLPGLDSNT